MQAIVTAHSDAPFPAVKQARDLWRHRHHSTTRETHTNRVREIGISRYACPVVVAAFLGQDVRVKRSDKAARVQQILDDLYPAPPIPLDHRDPFSLLIAVLLSAQTTDAQVNRVTPALFELASTPEAMAALEVSEIHHSIRSCGLAPSKARNISALAKILVAEHGGRVPDDAESLERLPGVGHKTASVVLAQAFHRSAFPVDTHIHRLAWRWGLSNGRSVEQTERDLKRAFPEESWNRLHLQMIYFGREHCTALRHDAQKCPICSWAMSKARMRKE